MGGGVGGQEEDGGQGGPTSRRGWGAGSSMGTPAPCSSWSCQCAQSRAGHTPRGSKRARAAGACHTGRARCLQAPPPRTPTCATTRTRSARCPRRRFLPCSAQRHLKARQQQIVRRRRWPACKRAPRSRAPPVAAPPPRLYSSLALQASMPATAQKPPARQAAGRALLLQLGWEALQQAAPRGGAQSRPWC